MKIKLITGFFVVVSGLGCQAIKHSDSDTRPEKKGFIEAYKISFVCGCLKGGTKGAFNEFLVRNNDLGLFTEVDLISHDKVREADSVGFAFSKRIKPLNYADAGDRVPNVSRCVRFALSKEIDRIARKSYRTTR